jgi:Flp pilus assembly protein TadD
VLELSPADDYAHYALGRALEKQGKDAEANGHYKLASSLRPESATYASRIRDLD